MRVRGHPSSVWSENCTSRGVAVGLASCSPYGHITHQEPLVAPRLCLGRLGHCQPCRQNS